MANRSAQNKATARSRRTAPTPPTPGKSWAAPTPPTDARSFSAYAVAPASADHARAARYMWEVYGNEAAFRALRRAGRLNEEGDWRTAADWLAVAAAIAGLDANGRD